MKILVEVYSCYGDWGGESFEGYIAKEESELEKYLIEEYLTSIEPKYMEEFKRFISGESNSFYVYRYQDWDDPTGYRFVRYTKEEALEAARRKYNTTVASIEFAFKGEE